MYTGELYYAHSFSALTLLVPSSYMSDHFYVFLKCHCHTSMICFMYSKSIINRICMHDPKYTCYHKRALSLKKYYWDGMYQGKQNQQDTLCLVRKTYWFFRIQNFEKAKITSFLFCKFRENLSCWEMKQLWCSILREVIMKGKM